MFQGNKDAAIEFRSVKWIFDTTGNTYNGNCSEVTNAHIHKKPNEHRGNYLTR